MILATPMATAPTLPSYSAAGSECFPLSSPSAQTPRSGLEDGHEVFVDPFAGWHAGT